MKKTKKKIAKSKKFLIISGVLLLAGLGAFFYPNIAKFFTGLYQNSVIDKFNDNIENADKLSYPTDPDLSDSNDYIDTPLLEDPLLEENGNNKSYDPKLLARLYAEIVKYNKELYESGQQIDDPFTYSQESFDLTQYSVYDNVFGYVSAPSIDLNIPIYLGASNYNMSLGAAQLTGTSIPIGGNNTNAVLAGHTGMISKTMFDNIVLLEKGDSVYITNLWYKLEYKVVYTEVILPTESDKIKIQEGKNMLTLFTCYPYGYNTYRYVVYCEIADD